MQAAEGCDLPLQRSVSFSCCSKAVRGRVARHCWHSVATACCCTVEERSVAPVFKLGAVQLQQQRHTAERTHLISVSAAAHIGLQPQGSPLLGCSTAYSLTLPYFH
jgi:hypothetical protein